MCESASVRVCLLRAAERVSESGRRASKRREGKAGRMWQERDDDDDDDDNDAEDDDSGREGEGERKRRMTPACEVKDGVESLSGEREKGERIQPEKPGASLPRQLTDG